MVKSFEDFDFEEDINYEVLDLENPSSISSYGADVLDNFEQLRNNFPDHFENDIYRSYEFTEPLGEIMEFNRSFTSENDSKEKIRKNRLASGVCNLLNKLSRGHIDLLHDNENYAEVYLNYLDNVQKLCEQIRKDKISLENDARFFMKFKLYVGMLLEKLELLITNGEAVLTDYKNGVSPNMVYVDVADERLMALRMTSEVMKGLCAQIDLKTAFSMRQKIKYDEYLQVTAPTLNIYASLAVGVKRDSSRLERLIKVRDAANETIKAASLKLSDNMEKILDMDKDSLITSDTLALIVKSYQDGATLLTSTQNEKVRTRNQILMTFDKYDEIFTRYRNVITKALMADNSFQGKGLKKIK